MKQKEAMMIAFDEEDASGTAVGVRDRNGEPADSVAERIPRRRKQNSTSASAGSASSDRSAAIYVAEIGKRLGRQALKQVAGVAKPDTILS